MATQQLSQSQPKITETFTNVYINNLDPSVDEATLRYLCETHGGRVISLVIIRNEEQASMGYGFCNFSTHEEALRAIREMNNLFVESKKISVSRAASKNERIQFLNSVHQQSLEYSPHENPNVYIKNLDYNIEEEDLRKVFDRFGPIINVRVMRDAVGNSRGFGFVSFKAHRDAQRAVDEMNGAKIGRFTIHTDFYEPKKSRQEKLERLHGSVRVPSPSGSSPSASSSSYSTSPTTTTTTTTAMNTTTAAVPNPAAAAAGGGTGGLTLSSGYSTSPTLTLPLRPLTQSPTLTLPLRPAGGSIGASVSSIAATTSSSSAATSPSLALPLRPAVTSPAMSPTLTLHTRPLATSPTFSLQPKPLATSPTLSLHARVTSPQPQFQAQWQSQVQLSPQQGAMYGQASSPQYQSQQQWQLDLGKNELSLMPDDILGSINALSLSGSASEDLTPTIPPATAAVTPSTAAAAAVPTAAPIANGYFGDAREAVVDDDDVTADFLGLGSEGGITPIGGATAGGGATAVSPSLFAGQPQTSSVSPFPAGGMGVPSFFCDPYSVAAASAPTTRGMEHWRSLTPARSPGGWGVQALEVDEELDPAEAERWRYSIFVYGLRYVTDPAEVCKLFFDFKNVIAKPVLSSRMIPTGVWKVAFDSEESVRMALRIAKSLYVRNRRIEAERCPEPPRPLNIHVMSSHHSYSLSPEARGIFAFKHEFMK